MRLMFWTKPEKAKEPAPSGECRHLWTNWSAPEPYEATGWTAHTLTMKQDRHCLHCNLYQRSLT